MAGGGECRIALAAIAGAHGVKGDVRLKLFTDSVENLARHKQVHVGGAVRQLLSAAAAGKNVIARFEGVSDRSSAEALRGSLVEIDRSQLAPLEDGEYYYADIVGLQAFDRDGNPVGTVVAVENYGAGDLLEVENQSGNRSLIPFRHGIAELEGDRIVLDREFLT